MKPALLFVPIAAGLLLVGAACAPVPVPTATTGATPTTGAAPTTGVAPSGGTSSTGAAPSSNTGAPGAPDAAVGIAPDRSGVATTSGVNVSAPASYSGAYQYASGTVNTEGIWVTGTGTVTLTPDQAILSLGVSAQEATVQQARDEAANALSAIMTQLKALGIAEKDIQTQYFNIQPVYRYDQIFKDGIQTGQQTLIGYSVTNQLTVKIRDINKAGQVIDEAVKAGGNLTRINNVYFTVEDSSAANTKAIELATKDAIARAQQFATLLGVSLGKPVYVTQVGGYNGPITKSVEAMDAGGRSSVPTPIQAGSLDVTAQVQVVFAIP